MRWPWSRQPFLPVGYVPFVPPEPEPDPLVEPRPDPVLRERSAVARRVAEQFGTDPMVAEQAAAEITMKALAFFRRRPPVRAPVAESDGPVVG